MKRILTIIFLAIFLCSCSGGGSGKNNTALDNEKDKNQTHEAVIKKSGDNENYLGKDRVELTLNNKDQRAVLYIKSEDITPSEETNKPIKVKFTINNSEQTFESLWNDGIYISVADFDSNDKAINIYVTETGTDIQSTTYIYSYDGQKLTKKGQFELFGKDFLYDERGNIYYWFESDNNQEINTHYDYNTGKAVSITDANLKVTLNKQSK